MKTAVVLLGLFVLLGCKAKTEEKVSIQADESAFSADFTLVFASCSDQNREQPLWKPILTHKPDVFIWGGDNVYADTDDMTKMQADYNKVWAHPDYVQLAAETEIIGTWDDHDYGKNDAGIEWEKKAEAQQLLLDFLKVPENDPLRNQEGVYHTKRYSTAGGSIKIILLDTRYFRTSLKESDVAGRRYDPWKQEDGGSVLGDTQWEWLASELEDETADFTVVISSIQLLSNKHGWEKWGNHPAEVDKMFTTVENAKSKNIIFLSGDRHLAEISAIGLNGIDYPLVDFTSSGLTHTYPDSPTDENPYRIGDVVKNLNFGVLEFDFGKRQVLMEIRGKNDTLYQDLTQQY